MAKRYGCSYKGGLPAFSVVLLKAGVKVVVCETLAGFLVREDGSWLRALSKLRLASLSALQGGEVAGAPVLPLP